MLGIIELGIQYRLWRSKTAGKGRPLAKMAKQLNEESGILKKEMSFVCGISGEATEDPVVSPVSGHIFDRRLIIKYIAENGTDPISHAELSEDSLVSIKTGGTGSAPRNISGTSIPSDDQKGLSKAILNKLDENSKTLAADCELRGKNLPEGLAKVEELAQLKKSAERDGIHSAGTPGITALDIKGSLSLTGGIDKNVVLYDRNKDPPVLQDFWGHSERINAVVLHPDTKTAISASADSDIRIWNSEERHAKYVIRVHQAPVNDISLNASGDYILSASDDSYWAFSDIRTGKSLCKVSVGSQIGVHCIEFHPDGLIFGTGAADSVVKIWDLKNQGIAHAFSGHTAAVRSIAFSENGYYLATGSDDGEVKLWDLRKRENLKTFATEEKQPINSLSFDMTGTFLGIGGQRVQVLDVKSWSEIVALSDHSGPVTGVRFGENARSLVTCSLDNTLRIFSF